MSLLLSLLLLLLILLFFLETESKIKKRRRPNSRLHRTERRFGDRGETNFVDLDKLISKFVQKKAEQVKRKVQWWDIYGTHPQLKNEPEYSAFQVTVQTNDIRYGNQNMRKARLRSPVSHWYENYGEKPIHKVVVCQHQSDATYQWQVNKGMKSKSTLRALGVVNPAMGINAEFREFIDLRSSKNQVPVQSKGLYKSRFRISVPPQRAVSVDCFVTGTVTLMPWQVDVIVSGWIAVWYEEPYEDHHLWFYRITQVTGPDLKRSDSGCTLTFNARGIFKALESVASNHNIYQHNLPNATDTDDEDYSQVTTKDSCAGGSDTKSDKNSDSKQETPDKKVKKAMEKVEKDSTWSDEKDGGDEVTETKALRPKIWVREETSENADDDNDDDDDNLEMELIPGDIPAHQLPPERSFNPFYK